MMMMTLFAIAILMVGVATGRLGSSSSFCERDGVECAQPSIAVERAVSLTGCMEACWKRHDCRSFQYYYDSSCFLKNAVCKDSEFRVRKGDTKYYIKGDANQCQMNNGGRQQTAFCEKAGLECVPNSIAVKRRVSVEECQQACRERADCRSVQYYYDKSCFLKNGVCSNGELRSRGDTQYYIQVENADQCQKGGQSQGQGAFCERKSRVCSHHNVDVVKDVSLEGCQNACRSRQDCRSVQYYGAHRYCYVKNDICPDSRLAERGDTNYYVRVENADQCQTQTETGPTFQYCYRGKVECKGHNIASVNDLTRAQCQNKCSESEDCRSFNYHNGHCQLKNFACAHFEVMGNPASDDYIKVPNKSECKYQWYIFD